ncbi:hypothetical protein HYE67_005827 [Fusarium culmorum]|uniref:Uncharacterized protein n=1 Tax=Fusarium culmorum TaxID=5516 RepID=A0A2T4GEJ1_FUSCU|nr:hypothetical protein FCULG_00010399 [Fusarium culmorum]QPC63596.1 hypothetical protein HYE67_005827 [Fusarium culmorum]
MSGITPIHRSPSDTSLEFEEFDYWDRYGCLTGHDVTNDQHRALLEVLRKNYKTTELLETFPFLIIGCQGSPPDEDKRPFSVARAIAIWRDARNSDMKHIVGDIGQGDDIEVEDDLILQMDFLEVRGSSKNIILQLANLWPECEAICVLWDQLVVELPFVSQEEHCARLQSLPRDIGMSPYSLRSLRFNNGPSPNSQGTRVRDTEPNSNEPLKSADCKIGDLFVFDTSGVGRQTMAYFGRRFTMGRKEAQNSESHEAADGVKYIAFEQDAFISNSPETIKKLLESGCESVLLQPSKASLGSKRRRTPKLTMEEGGEVGVVLYVDDLQLKNIDDIGQYIMYADSFQ